MASIDMRSLSGDERHQRREQIIALRAAGSTYDEIACRTGVSKTGVFNICKRHRIEGPAALHDAPNGPLAGAQRLLDPGQEAMLRRLILRHTPEQLALPDLLWSSAAVAQLIEQRCHARLRPRTVRKYLARWGYGARPRMQVADEPTPGAFQQWLDDDYPGIVIRARTQAAVIHWGDEGGLQGFETRPHLTMLSTVTNRGERHWMDFARAPDAEALIGFLTRLTRGSTAKLFLIHGNLRVHEGDALALWLAEHEELIEVFCLPGHVSSGAPAHLQSFPLAA
jgi:transposase